MKTTMKTVGLLGGMSWDSTVVYYQVLNRLVRERLGGLHSAPVLLHSFDFAEVVALQQRGDWAGAAAMLSQAAEGLENAGADVVAICTNTMHRVAPQVQSSLSVPLLHIADATRAAVVAEGIGVVGLLGTRYTMEQDFLRGRLAASGGPRVLVPEGTGLGAVHDIIFSELCQGRALDGSRAALLGIIDGLARRGARGIILGCTELMLLVQQSDCPLPLFDTTTLHARALADFCLAGDAPDTAHLAAGRLLALAR